MPFDPKGKPLVLSYEVKLQNGLDCGGAYIKLLTESAEVRRRFLSMSAAPLASRVTRTLTQVLVLDAQGIQAEEFSDKTP